MKPEYPNKNDYDEKFWKNNYQIDLHNGGTYLINADNEQNAIDYLIDYIVEKYPGLVMDREEEEEEEYLDEYINGGNEGRYLNIGYHEMSFKQI